MLVAEILPYFYLNWKNGVVLYTFNIFFFSYVFSLDFTITSIVYHSSLPLVSYNTCYRDLILKTGQKFTIENTAYCRQYIWICKQTKLSTDIKKIIKFSSRNWFTFIIKQFLQDFIPSVQDRILSQSRLKLFRFNNAEIHLHHKKAETTHW